MPPSATGGSGLSSRGRLRNSRCSLAMSRRCLNTVASVASTPITAPAAKNTSSTRITGAPPYLVEIQAQADAIGVLERKQKQRQEQDDAQGPGESAHIPIASEKTSGIENMPLVSACRPRANSSPRAHAVPCRP